jgi:hypothetical protein
MRGLTQLNHGSTTETSAQPHDNTCTMTAFRDRFVCKALREISATSPNKRIALGFSPNSRAQKDTLVEFLIMWSTSHNRLSHALLDHDNASLKEAVSKSKCRNQNRQQSYQ